jgi:hypothetical protein
MMSYADCDSNQPCKIREVIPDVQERILFGLTKTNEIWIQIDRLIYALDGPQSTPPDELDKPLDRQYGSLETLEKTTRELREDLIQIERKLREKLDVLLGMK